jgi:hypothetical protein
VVRVAGVGVVAGCTGTSPRKGVDVGELGPWLLVRATAALLGGSILPEQVGASLVPAINGGVGLGREDVAGQVGREGLASVRVLKGPFPNGVLQVGHVLLGAEEDFERLPSREAALGEGGDAGGLEVVIGRLKGVLAAGDGPDVGDILIIALDEEGYGWVSIRAVRVAVDRELLADVQS